MLPGKIPAYALAHGHVQNKTVTSENTNTNCFNKTTFYDSGNLDQTEADLVNEETFDLSIHCTHIGLAMVFSKTHYYNPVKISPGYIETSGATRLWRLLVCGLQIG